MKYVLLAFIMLIVEFAFCKQLCKSDDTIGILSIIIIVIQLVFLVGSIFSTEKSLKNNFNEDGTKR